MNRTTRRSFLKSAALTGAASASHILPASAAEPLPEKASSGAKVEVSWLGGVAPSLASGVSWGVPWARGAVRPETRFSLMAGGKPLAVQSWPMAFWPDGSLKWSGVATVALGGPLVLSAARTSEAAAPAVKLSDKAGLVTVDTGVLQCVIPAAGSDRLVQSMSIEGRAVAAVGRLVCVLQTGPDDAADETQPRERFMSLVRKVTVEQRGPIRAVVKLEGMHKGVRSGREWLPFHVRLYFYAGQTSVRMVHTVFYDGDQQHDFIRGLGVTFEVPLREEVQNRHVRFSGADGGLWSEPIQPLVGRAGASRIVTDAGGKDVYPSQLEGRRVPNRAEMTLQGQRLVADWAVWDDFKLSQPTSEGFTIHKRTNAQSTWLASAAGKRSSGYAFVGDVSGGLGISLRNFWQSFPAQLEVRGAAHEAAELTAWMWSPEAGAMDLRHYDTRAHGLEASYEDVQPGNSTPFGIARTSELTLWPAGSVPEKAASAAMAVAGANPPMLVASPKHYHDVRAFGLWSVRDTSTPFRAAVEQGLDATLELYLSQVDERHWYGFWNYGDVMHSFDRPRHMWRYDLGGMAWDNSELAPDTWLWYSFLRSGRADIFRMAEAMTRHTGEVDTYHFGPMAGLGTRHGVSHWGDGAKEARIGQAAFRRFFYYLSTDERTGDVMREAMQAEKSVAAYDPMRLADPPRAGDEKFPVRVRSGPDWLAIAGNWFTEWERTGDNRWRDKIVAGMKSIEAMPHGFRTGRNMLMGFDPSTGVLTARDSSLGMYNLATIMGGAEMMFELNLSIDDPAWHKVWAEFCANSGAVISTGKLQAYAYSETKDPALARAAVRSLHTTSAANTRAEPPNALASMEDGTDTNGSAQYGLTAIAVLELCAEVLPSLIPSGDASRT